jgi:GT2 family glycosyltransferase
MAELTPNLVRPATSFSVIVPTYRRVADLKRCLNALMSQTRAADEIIITVRDTDAETMTFVREQQRTTSTLKVVGVSIPGVIAAMNAGLQAAGGDLIALTDDDAAPWPDWLARLESQFNADPRLGGVGGRDWVYHAGLLSEGYAENAGQMSWFGRVSSGHHIVVGPPREVVVLKGVNCAYRAAPLRKIGFDSRLAGSGAQVHWELALGLAMMRSGWKLVLDPAIGVDHLPATRFDEDQRGTFNSLAQRNAVFNETLLLAEHLRGGSRLAFLVWAVFIGTRSAPGLLQVPRLAIIRRAHLPGLWWATMRGRVAGWAAASRTRASKVSSRDHQAALVPSSSGVQR